MSGGAYGIDARRPPRRPSTPQAAPTVAVLACGVDVAYPRAHDRLLAQIAEQGLVVSEVPPGSAPTRVRFLVRNRLIAALTRGTVVVEAARRSGSLSTAGRAVDLGRPVMAVPGPVTSALSRPGCHDLIRTGKAVLVDQVGRGARARSERPGEHLLGRRAAAAHPRDGLPESVRRVLDAVPGPAAGRGGAHRADRGAVRPGGAAGPAAAADGRAGRAASTAAGA